jgi:hypothetical protein
MVLLLVVFWSAAHGATLIRVYCSCFFANSSRIPANAPHRSSIAADWQEQPSRF